MDEREQREQNRDDVAEARSTKRDTEVKRREKRRDKNFDLFVVSVMLVVILTALAGTYIAYTNARDSDRRAEAALVQSQAALVRARKNRLVVQYKLCVGQNQLKRVTNLDRETFQASILQQEHSLKVVKDPVLHKLIQTGLQRSRKELAARPFLPALKCKKLVSSPPVPPPVP